MIRPAGLRQRAHFAALLTTIVSAARHSATWFEPDCRHLRLWRLLLLAVLVQRSTHLLDLAHVLLPFRRGTSIKTVAQGIGAFLRSKHCPLARLSPVLLAAPLTQLDPSRLLRAHGRVLLVVDGTEYAKRSRGHGKRNRQMQHLGRVRNAKGKRSGTTFGYVDIWAGLILKGKRFARRAPALARQLFSSTHPRGTSQNQVEEAVLEAALTAASQRPWPSLVVADRGFGRKALLIRLAKRQQALVIRIDPDILVQARGMSKEALLDSVLAEQPWLGGVGPWFGGQDGLPSTDAAGEDLLQTEWRSEGESSGDAEFRGGGTSSSRSGATGGGNQPADAECGGRAEGGKHLCAALGGGDRV